MTTLCGHQFCQICIDTWNKNSCPVCRQQIYAEHEPNTDPNKDFRDLIGNGRYHIITTIFVSEPRPFRMTEDQYRVISNENIIVFMNDITSRISLHTSVLGDVIERYG